MDVYGVCVCVFIWTSHANCSFSSSLKPLIKYYDFKLAPAHFNGHLARNLHQPECTIQNMFGPAWLGLAWLRCFVNPKSNAKIGNHFINATTAPPSECVCVCGEHYRRIWWVKSHHAVWCLSLYVYSIAYLLWQEIEHKSKERCRSTERLDYRSFIDIRHQRASTKNFWLDWSRTY